MATHPRADELIAGLRDHGVRRARVLPDATASAGRDGAVRAGSRGSLPVTDELAATNLALPMSPTLDAERVREVVAALAAVA